MYILSFQAESLVLRSIGPFYGQKEMLKEKILIVDDSEMNRSILADMLADEFEITEAENGVEAVSILQNHSNEYSLVLLDIVMPEMGGFDVLAVMNRFGWIEDVPVIMVSAETASEQIERAYELGATDFIMRPFDASIVHRRVVNTILLYAKQKKLVSIVEEQISEKEQNSSMMVDILSHIVEFRNGESGLHIQHVRTLTDLLLHKLCAVTDRYPLTEADISVISMASALHDIGKIGIDDKILNKPGRLTDEEFAVMKTHSAIGAQMLEDLPVHKNNPIVVRAYEICRWHHERYDGRGYPDGLKGDDIPISAQVVALADVYDALTSERVYKKAIPHDEAVDMILNGKCGSFNPVLLECLAQNALHVKNALSIDAQKTSKRQQIRSFADAVMQSKGGSASERTLRLLDYERMKHNFFAEMSEEIQFEYSAGTDILKLSPWGARKLGVPENIISPSENMALSALLGEGWWQRIGDLLNTTTPEKPECSREEQLLLGGEYRWYNIIIRAIWSDDNPPQITGAIGKAVDIHDARMRFNELKEKSIRDPLTGLLNRAGAREQIEPRIHGFPDHKYAFAIFDIDFFKLANDEHGHQFGDKVLSYIAQRLNHSIRQSDLCARIGGDEFLIFFEYDTDIHPIIARIFKALCGVIDGFEVHISMGVSEMQEEGESYEILFRRADQALYFSKRAGRAQYHLYDESMKDILTDREPDSDYEERYGESDPKDPKNPKNHETK